MERGRHPRCKGERGLIRGRERKEFSLSIVPSPRLVTKRPATMKCISQNVLPRHEEKTTRYRKKIPFPMLSVAGKEDHPSNSYLLESPSNRVIFYSKIVYRRMSIFANVAYMWERIASRVWKSWENGPQSRNKCLRRTWLHVHVYRRNGREHAKTGVVVTELIPMLPGLTWKLVLT